MKAAPESWVLLVHSIPPNPPYSRAKTMRRLTQLGALPLKRSTYLLPASEGALEDFQWLRQEIETDGGEAWVLEARFVGGLRNEEIREKFRAIRTAEYKNLSADARTLLERLRNSSAAPPAEAVETDRRRLRRRLSAAQQIDFFHADGRDEVEALMSTLDRLSEPTAKTSAQSVSRGELRARTWITRRGVKVDRMASAWLIRRFIDPAATFAFVAPDDVLPVANGVRFDMFEGEFTHDGNRCTFEVLLEASGRAADPGLVAIGHIVHDIDLREERYQRPETAGVSAMIDGLVARFDDDHRRLSESAPLFDTLYASLGGQPGASSSGA
jgi:hypothetical protein